MDSPDVYSSGIWDVVKWLLLAIGLGILFTSITNEDTTCGQYDWKRGVNGEWYCER